MSPQPSANAKIDSDPTPSFPGFELYQRLVEAWSGGLLDHARVYNENWMKLRNGQFSVVDALSSVARLWETNYDTAMGLFMAPFRQDNIQWINFVVKVTRGSALIPPTQRIDMPRPLPQSTGPTIVGVHVLGKPLGGHQSIEGGSLFTFTTDRRTLFVGINEVGLKAELAGWTKVAWKKEDVADFLGLVFAGPPDSGQPLAVVTLRLMGGG